MWETQDGMGWWLVWLVVFWIVFIGVVLWGTARVGRRGNTRRRIHRGGSLQIARERYARGEISRAEFEQIKRDVS